MRKKFRSYNQARFDGGPPSREDARTAWANRIVDNLELGDHVSTAEVASWPAEVHAQVRKGLERRHLAIRGERVVSL